MIISAGTLGKWKTAIQMFAIPCVLIQEPILQIPIYEIGFWLLWLSVAFSIVSGVQYYLGYKKSLKGSLA